MTTRFHLELTQHVYDRETTLADVHSALERLLHVSSTVFDTIESRVEQYSCQLGRLESRIESIENRVSRVASNPSSAFTLLCTSTFPSNNNLVTSKELFADLPLLQQGPGSNAREDPLRNSRRNATGEDDPVIPRAAIELEQRIDSMLKKKTVEMRAKKELEELSHRTMVRDERSDIVKLSNCFEQDQLRDDGNLADMGPAPESLRFPYRTTAFAGKTPSHPATNPSEPQLDHHTTQASKDVGYIPLSKEAHQLGLPTSLGGLLPDVAETAQSRVLRLRITDEKTDKSTKSNPDEAKKQRDSETQDHQQIQAQAQPDQVPQVASKPEIAETPTAPTRPALDPSRSSLMEAIRATKTLRSTAAKQSPQSATKGAPETNRGEGANRKPISLADEMREKLARRQKALSGERDEEEQLEERRRKGKEDASSDSGSSMPSIRSHMVTGPSRRRASDVKRNQNLLGQDQGPPARRAPPTTEHCSFAGLDGLLNRELSRKGDLIRPPSPKPTSSSAGDWEES